MASASVLFLGLRDQVKDDFGVAGGLEDRAMRLQSRAHLAGVHQVAVVRQRDQPLLHSTRIGCAFSSAESPVVE